MSGATRCVGESEEPDELLMQRYAEGDARAFDALFQRYEPRAYAFFLKRTGSPERAEDLYQELFLRIHRARDRYDPTLAFTPWFFQIAHHLLIDDRRRSFRSHEVPIGDREPREAQPGSEAEVAGRECFDRLMDVLSVEERYVVLSAKIDGISYPELAEHLGKSADAVKKMASRAIGRLRASAAEGTALGMYAG